jgi:hypothetical protein
VLGGLGHAEAIGSRTRRPEAEDRQADAGVATYRRREPEKSLLHETVREHLKTFPAEFEQDGRVRCTACGDELLVAFSCKGRGICPSCTTRRMQGTATHLVDRVLPRVPMRQWVLSLPRWARFLIARDPKLITRTLQLSLRSIFARQRLRARRIGARGAQAGAVTFVQRFGSALNLNVHFHCVIPDGVWVREEDVACFVPLPGLTDGVHLHANNREGLAHLCGYGARPPFAQERLSALPDGKLAYHMKRQLGDGQEVLVLEPRELLRRLATLVPPPRAHLVRYHGVFGPASSWRAEVVPAAPPPVCPAAVKPKDAPVLEPEDKPPRRPDSRIPWSELLLRIFREDILACPCGGRRKVIAFISQRPVIEQILSHLGLPTTVPPTAPARYTGLDGDPCWQDDVPELQQSLR